MVPPSPEATHPGDVSSQQVSSLRRPQPVPSNVRLEPTTRIGLWRGANDIPHGWMKSLFEQSGFNHRTIASTDFNRDIGTRTTRSSSPWHDRDHRRQA